MSSTIPVLVVGAGPAGLVAALTLAQNGIPVRIIDKDAVFHTGSRGFGVQVSKNASNLAMFKETDPV